MPMRQTAIAFTSKKLSLEGVLTTPSGTSGPSPAVVVCHPHPLLGGDMDNTVVTTISRAADRAGIATLRFNFRGVGSSQGIFSNGKGEQDDVKAALDLLQHWPDVDARRLALVGYSFGASVVLGGLKHYKAARALALIAPPISTVQDATVIGDRRPKLFVVGQHDAVVSPIALQRALDKVRPPVRFVEVPGADHSLLGQEDTVARHVVEFIRMAK